MDKHAVGIDTACVFGGKLTAYVVNSMGGVSVVSVDAKRQYAVPMKDD
ncbi:MAG: hypothetical protein IIC87_07535 [Chloroflexi bacterium]|nr:hypothetical protein [Chloroflexota bacterium]